MKEYHKIQTVFLRNPEDNFKTLLEGQWALDAGEKGSGSHQCAGQGGVHVAHGNHPVGLQILEHGFEAHHDLSGLDPVAG